MIYLTAIGLTPGGSSTVHIHTQTRHRTTQSTQTLHKTTQLTNWEERGPCPVFAAVRFLCGRAPSLQAVPRLYEEKCFRYK